MNFNSQAKGFTLSELLVSLSVLGLIAAFAIPKVLTAVDKQATQAVGKEAISMITAAYDSLKADNNGMVGIGTSGTSLARKMNYVSATPVIPATGNATGSPELKLHNGGTITFNGDDSFQSTTANPGFIRFNIDPNGTATTNGPGAVSVNLGYDGRLWLQHDGYSAGSATTPVNQFVTNYSEGTAVSIAAAVPSSGDGTDTTWMKW